MSFAEEIWVPTEKPPKTKGILSAVLATIALLGSWVLLAPAFAKGATLTVSGEYSNSLLSPSSGTFLGTITTNGDNITDVDITFPVVSDFIYVEDSVPAAGGTWDLTAADLDGLELDLIFSTTPLPGSLIGFTGGNIVLGQVLDPAGFRVSRRRDQNLRQRDLLGGSASVPLSGNPQG